MNKKLNYLIIIIFILPVLVLAEISLKPSCESHYEGEQILFLKSSDLNNDGREEIILGTGISGVVQDYEYNRDSCEHEWGHRKSFNVGGSISEIQITDINGDSKVDILIGAEKSIEVRPTNPQAHVSVIDGKHFIQNWVDRDMCIQPTSISFGDLDNDGIDNIVSGGSRKVCAYEDLNEKRPKIIWRYTPPLDVLMVKVIDFEKDGQNEILVVSKSRNMGVLDILNSDGTRVASFNISNGFYSGGGKKIVQTTDIDKDGVIDVVLATNNGVHAYSIKKGLIWKFHPDTDDERAMLSSAIYLGKNEILVGANPYIYNIDFMGNQIWKTPVKGTIYKIGKYDVNKDGVDEIIAGGYQYLYIYTPQGELITRFYRSQFGGKWVADSMNEINTDVSKVEFKDFLIGDFDKDDEPEIVVAYNIMKARTAVMDQIAKSNLLIFEIENRVFTKSETVFIEKENEVKTTTTTTIIEKDSTDISDIYGEPENTNEIEPDEEKRKICCIPLLPIILFIGLVLGFNLPSNLGF